MFVKSTRDMTVTDDDMILITNGSKDILCLNAYDEKFERFNFDRQYSKDEQFKYPNFDKRFQNIKNPTFTRNVFHSYLQI